MRQFTVMKTTLREEATIPVLAIDAFHHAFRQASLSDMGVTYVKDGQLVQQLHGEITVIQDLSAAYTLPKLKRSVLKRKKKQEVLA